MIINTSNAKHYTWGNSCDGWHYLNTNSLSVIKERMPVGCFEEMHYHNVAQQLFYIVEGVASIRMNEVTYTVNQGSALHVPAKTSHQLRNDGKSELVFLVISQPHSHGDKIRTEE